MRVRFGWIWCHIKTGATFGVIKKGKTANLYTFFKIRAGRTTQLFDPNSEHEYCTDIYS